MTEHCENCKFYVKAPLAPKQGDCRAKSPIIIGMTQQGPVSGWPSTQDGLWCGEHKPKLAFGPLP